MAPELLQLQARASFSGPRTRRHGHTANEFQLRGAGRLGTFVVTSDGARPVLVWRSTRWR